MDSTLVAVLGGAVVAGGGGLLVPRLIAMVPPYEPDAPGAPDAPDAPDARDEADEADARDEPGEGDAGHPAEEPPEAYAAIAALPGLALKAAATAAVAGALVGWALGWHWGLALWVPLVPLYVALALVDWRTRLLPTYLIRPAYVVLVVLVVLGWLLTRDSEALVRAALGWLIAGGLYAVFWFVYPRGLGFGDVRLSGVLGISLGWVGWGPLLVGVYAGFLLGGVVGGLLALLRVFHRRSFPFGPFMLLGALAGLLWGGPLWAGFTAG